MLIAAIWSLVAAPALCRAGALTVCCTHHETTTATPACCDADEHTQRDEPASPASEKRECGSCADVCKGIAKPAEDRGLSELVDHAQPGAGDATPECLTTFIAPLRFAHDRVLIGLCLPYPASDLPLRI